MKQLCWLLLTVSVLSACNKSRSDASAGTVAGTKATGFQVYTISPGTHYSDAAFYKPVELTALRFSVRFDSSAVYKTKNPENQYDINKLFGFSDNGAQHHQYSARLGWRWSDGALRLFAYVYNDGQRSAEEITAVPIGQILACQIAVAGNHYRFTVNGISKTLPRKAAAAQAKGYQLYPYFGGDEAAPHTIRIWMKEEA